MAYNVQFIGSTVSISLLSGQLTLNATAADLLAASPVLSIALLQAFIAHEATADPTNASAINGILTAEITAEQTPPKV